MLSLKITITKSKRWISVNMNDLIKMKITMNNSNVCMLYLETGKTILFNRSFSIENQSK